MQTSLTIWQNSFELSCSLPCRKMFIFYFRQSQLSLSVRRNVEKFFYFTGKTDFFLLQYSISTQQQCFVYIWTMTKVEIRGIVAKRKWKHCLVTETGLILPMKLKCGWPLVFSLFVPLLTSDLSQSKRFAHPSNTKIPNLKIFSEIFTDKDFFILLRLCVLLQTGDRHFFLIMISETIIN